MTRTTAKHLAIATLISAGVLAAGGAARADHRGGGSPPPSGGHPPARPSSGGMPSYHPPAQHPGGNGPVHRPPAPVTPTRPAPAPTARPTVRPALAPVLTPRVAGPSAPARGPAGFGLSGADNQGLLSVMNRVGPKTQDALQAALAGNLLTAEQRSYLLGAIEKNPKLTAKEKGALAAALQSDRDEKRKLAGGGGGAVVIDGGPAVVPGGWVPASATEVVVTTGGTPTLAPAGRGMRVTAAHAGWPASEAGLREGDVVVSVDGTPVASTDEVKACLAGKEEVEVVFVNGETGRLESTRVAPRQGLIGLSGETMELPSTGS